MQPAGRSTGRAAEQRLRTPVTCNRATRAGCHVSRVGFLHAFPRTLAHPHRRTRQTSKSHSRRMLAELSRTLQQRRPAADWTDIIFLPILYMARGAPVQLSACAPLPAAPRAGAARGPAPLRRWSGRPRRSCRCDVAPLQFFRAPRARAQRAVRPGLGVRRRGRGRLRRRAAAVLRRRRRHRRRGGRAPAPRGGLARARRALHAPRRALRPGASDRAAQAAATRAPRPSVSRLLFSFFSADAASPRLQGRALLVSLGEEEAGAPLPSTTIKARAERRAPRSRRALTPQLRRAPPAGVGRLAPAPGRARGRRRAAVRARAQAVCAKVQPCDGTQPFVFASP